MSRNGKSGRKSTRLIKDIADKYSISEREIEQFADIDHPLFSFKYLKDVSIDRCNDASFFYGFLMRLQKLSELGWTEIRKSSRHSFGMEKIPVEQIVPFRKLPSFITREGELDVFRSAGDNRTFVGLQQGKIFYIFFIEYAFGDICRH